MSALSAGLFKIQPAKGPHQKKQTSERTNLMLMTIAIILIVLWALGLVTSASLGGFIHILLVLAIIMILIRVIQGRRIL
jgi:hypothetical protein